MPITIFDIETLKNCFTLTAVEVGTKKVSSFVIHKSLDQRGELLEFLATEGLVMVGFNNLKFDYPVLDNIFSDDLPQGGDKLARWLYKKAQKQINDEKQFAIRDPRIPQVDLMAIHHFDNAARATSLKWLQINMGFHNVADMPVDHDSLVTEDQIPLILEYNLNDVMATLELYERSQGKIALRERLSAKYDIDMTNFPDTKIGEMIVLKMLSDRTGMSIEGLKKCRTYRKNMKLGDCILPSVNFKSPEFNKVLEKFKGMIFSDKKEEIAVVMDDVEYYFGIGGLHACRKPGIFSNIASCDVTGYYPSLAVAQKFAPQHFGEDFYEVYKQIAIERSQYPKGSDENVALKLAQNGVFGKSNSEYSAFYDPMFFAKITINGQLLLAMLCERITLSGAGKIMLANTDGIEVSVRDEAKFLELCGMWEKKFGLKLEHSKYKTLAVRDINNYIGVTTTGKVKEKGAFVTTPELHQDHSQLIVPHALREYFVNNVEIKDTIDSCQDIGKFLIGRRAKTGKFVAKDTTGQWMLPKHIRYYVSKGGCTLYKRLKKGDVAINKGYSITLCNKWPEKLVNTDKKYYLKEANKLFITLFQ